MLGMGQVGNGVGADGRHLAARKPTVAGGSDTSSSIRPSRDNKPPTPAIASLITGEKWKITPNYLGHLGIFILLSTTSRLYLDLQD
jgi:hypothetical protein